MHGPSEVSDYLKSYTKVPYGSVEWSRIEYSIQLALGSTTATISNIWSVINPALAHKFAKQNKDKTIIESWIETACLDKQNSPEKIVEEGFTFPKTGLVFPTGNIGLSYKSKQKTYEMMFLRIAVGRSYCIPQEQGLTIQDKSNLPKGYDSVYVIQDTEQTSYQNDKFFKNDYILFENSQVLPMYVIHFEFNPEKERAIENPVCDLCQNNLAVCYCVTEETNLCFDCDGKHHAKMGKLVTKHKRIHISEKPKEFGYCLDHPDVKIEYFCLSETKPLCPTCKISGSHSRGDKASHQIMKISEAYQKSLFESKEYDPGLDKKKGYFSDLIDKVDSHIKDINTNVNQIEEEIYKLLERLLVQLRSETQKKIDLLLSEKLEIKRRHDQIQWLQSFLKYQELMVSPSDYLNSWTRHLMKRDEILSLRDPILLDIKPDLRIVGLTEIRTKSVSQANSEEGYRDHYSQDSRHSNINPPEKEPENIEKDLAIRFKSNPTLAKLIKNLTYEEIPKMIMNSIRMPYIPPIQEKNFTSDGIIYEREALAIPQREYETAAVDDIKEPKSNTFLPTESIYRNATLMNSISSGPNPNPIQSNSESNGSTKLKEKLQNSQDINIDNYRSSMKKPAKLGFSLSSIAGERLQQYTKLYGEISLLNIFPNTKILNVTESKVLYLNIPFNIDNPPKLALLYQKNDSNVLIPEMQDLFKNPENQANIIVFKYKNQKFGGYASHSWNHRSEKSFGDKSCFLFNLTKDSKLLPIGQENVVYQWQGRTSFSFGKIDLVIDDNFNECSSEVEKCYFTGQDLNKEEAKSFLTGSKQIIKPDIVEIYAIKSSKEFEII